MKSKIFKILIITGLLLLVTIGFVLADTVKINGKNFGSNGGSYNSAFQGKGKGLCDITWDNVKGKYYTAGNVYNDYQAFIKDSNDGYCLNENAGDGKDSRFYVAAIVDINGGNVTVRSRGTKGNPETEYVGEAAAEMAKMIWYRYESSDAHTFSSESANKYVVQYWFNHWGWNKLYAKISDLINDESTRPTSNTISSLKNYISVDYYNLNNLSIMANGALSTEEGNFSVSGKTYNTKMGKYKIVTNTKLSYQINVVGKSGKKYPGVFKNGYVYVNITEDIEKVEITQSYEGYKARLIVLGTGDSQGRMIAYGEKETISNTASSDAPPNNTDVSLQKYITKVNGNKINSSQTDKTNRKNLRTSTSETNEKVKDKISLNNTVANANKKVYKQANPVEISAGDTVTYTIEVYNNSGQEATNVVVKDRLPYYKSGEDIISYASIEKVDYIKDGKTKTVKWEDDETGSNTYEYTIEKLEAKESVTFEITVRFNVHSAKVLTNSAWISSTSPKNTKKYRTVDRDYVEMKQYSVSLEKFITEVSDKDGNNAVTYNNRAGLRHNDSLKSGDINKKLDKKNKKVSVDTGDIVTYTIRLKNTGNNPVKVTQIYDRFSESSNVKLVHTGEITGNGGGTITDNRYDGPENKWTFDGIGRYLIEFGNAQEIAAGKYVDVKIKFKVVVPTTLTKNSYILINKAGIAELKNGNDVVVKDNDGTDNNFDQDWIQTNIYAVSLEKYVSKVITEVIENETKVSEQVTYYDREGKAEHKFDDNIETKERFKYDNAVSVAERDKVTYTIKVTNDGQSKVIISDIADYFPNGVNSYKGDIYCTEFEDGKGQTEHIVNYPDNNIIEPGDSKSFEVEVDVTEPNYSKNTLKNVAEIISMKNRNDETVLDTTPNNNKDADYIVLDQSTKTEFIVEKVWDDNNDEDGLRPEKIRVQLYKNGEPLGEPVSITEDDDWKYTWRNLDLYDENSDNQNVYDAREIIEGNIEQYYSVEYPTQEENSNKVVIKNTINPTEYISKTVKKLWDHGDNPTEKWPKSVEVQLYKNGIVESTVTLNADNGWQKKWENLPKSVNGEEIKYEIKEKEGQENLVDYVSTSVEIGATTTITNTFNPPPSETISHTVQKVWEDSNNTAGKRPDKIKVQLYKNGEPEGDKVELGLYEEDGETKWKWEHTWDNLDANYSYRVEEVDVPEGYEAKIEPYGDITTITNIYNPDISKTVQKIWDHGDNPTENWPDSVTLQLYKNGVPEGAEVIINKPEDPDDEWQSYTWDNLEDGYDYDVREVDIPEGYTPFYMDNDDGSITIENRYTHTQTVSKTVKKVWNHGDNPTENWPNSVKLQLYKNGVPEGAPVTINKPEDSNAEWQYTWNDLVSGYDYTVEELEVPENYVTESSDDGEITTITNTYIEPAEPISYKVQKIWDDNDNAAGKRPTSIEVYLKKDGNVIESVYLGEEYEWKWEYIWNNLEIGHEYTVVENVPAEYIAQYAEYDDITIITNKLTTQPVYISKTVQKIWDDNDNAAGKRPDSIVVNLLRNGVVYKTETLDEGNGWQYTWNDLPDGYTYSIKELDVPEYISNISYKNDIFTIKNKYNPDTTDTLKIVKKIWIDENNKYNTRPESIEVELYKNATLVNTVILNKDNGWEYRWNIDGEGNYSVREKNVPTGYTATYGAQDGKIMIINTYDSPDSPDVIIGGYVWNDKALDKTQDNYNGILDAEQENVLEGIKVYLYRVGVERPIAETYTSRNGYYSFINRDIKTNVVTEPHKQYIKGPKVQGTNRWEGTYYSYYVVFEYDGVTYTSTPDGRSCESIINSNKDYDTDSNAKEDFDTRVNFNNKFNPVNNQSGINYTTKNEDGYIPQSNHEYNSSMKMQSVTETINLGSLLKGKDYSKEDDLNSIRSIEDKLKYVGLGLRGRDIFDLELTSDVDNIKVTVNNVPGVYKYSNKVELRRTDLTAETTTDEDMANRVSEAEHIYVDSQEQNIRATDIGVNQDYTTEENALYESALKSYINGYRKLYGDTIIKEQSGINEIKVTYKITVHNTSRTAGIATKITNYYDDSYTFVRAYKGDTNLTTSPGAGGTGYKSEIITIPSETLLNQAESMDIYVEYILNNPLSKLKDIQRLSTYNMAEITEYIAACAEGQTEYTRGLIDKDSAPGSVNKEQVRTTDTLNQNTSTAEGNPTTVNYYFNKKLEANKDVTEYLQKLKYEDDTYATPTIYFVKDDSEESKRTLSGIVFRDETQINGTNIKTGNGKYDVGAEGEVGVFGATVTLVEMAKVKESNGDEYETPLERFVTTTDKDGKFEFSGYLPGKYFVRYYYGNRTQTVLLNQSEDGSVNKYSFNGEDYQSTNNKYAVEGLETNILKYYSGELDDEQKNFWHLYNENEGISTAQDNSDRRAWVSNNVIDLEHGNNIMELLNDVREGLSLDEYNEKLYDGKFYGGDYLDQNSLIYKTYMSANTENMILSVEKPKFEGDKYIPQEKYTSGYKVENMNFGIAEVPVTTIDLQKNVEEFNIVDAAGENKIAGIKRDGVDANGNVKWIVTAGDVLVGDTLDVSMEDEKLQGARLQVKYNVTSNMDVELNYDNGEGVQVTITGIADFINNNLTYNPALGDNDRFWEVITHEQLQAMFDNDPNTKLGTVDPDGTIHNVVVKAKAENPALLANGGTATIVLEKVLSSTDSTLEDIIRNTVDIYQYSNIVEIVSLDYRNYKNGEKPPLKDRVRIPQRYIIIPGRQYDFAVSDETITIHPPTGDNMSVTYYVIAAIGLAVLAVGVLGIKKYVIKK